VEGAPPEKVVATVDGVAVPPALFDSDRPTDPGSHELKVSSPGFLPQTVSTYVADGSVASVSVKLLPDPNAGAVPPTGATQSTSGTPAPEGTPQGSTPGTSPPSGTTTTLSMGASTGGSMNGIAIGAFVAGGVGVAVGTVFGILALGKKSSLDHDCPTKSTCPSSSQGDIDGLKTDSTVSTVGFGLGIVGVAVGAVLLATSHGHEGQAASSETTSPRVTAWVGPGSIGLRGAFE
jgi:hypothetical protein